jgi:sugar phosphate isomerase/epimerase
MFTLREYLKTLQDIESTLKRIKLMNFNMVQLSGLGIFDFDWLGDKLKEIGIEVCGTHSPWARMEEPLELKKLIDDHKKLGSPQIGLGSKPPIYSGTYEGYTEFIKKINEICKMVNDSGLTFGYHNHDFEFEKFNGVCAFDRMTEECPDMKITLDVFWVQAGGKNPCD